MKRIGLITALVLFTMLSSASCKQRKEQKQEEPLIVDLQQNNQKIATPKIQVAILLDVSGSMDGLIDQAKSRLWNIVNTMTTLKYQGKEPEIEIALYAYGIAGCNYVNGIKCDSENYLSQLTPFTTDLDLISEKLFALTTSGSQEYCGTVISKATKDLDWGNSKADMKLIYIAGNEIFEQGNISYKKSIPLAVEQSIYVNTIHCGDERTGIQDLWRDAAELGKGKFFNIDANRQVRYVATPYDEQIHACNRKLNDTYVSYGAVGENKKMNQMAQDRNASSVSSGSMTERALSKSKKAYKNSNWDLVDAVNNKDVDVEKIAQSELPAELQNKSAEEIKQVVETKNKERESIQKEMAELGKLRQTYLDKEMNKSDEDLDLGKAISASILELANKKGYTQES